MEEVKEEEKAVSNEVTVSSIKVKKLRNLKYFREWTDEQIIDWVKLREPKERPPENPNDIISEIPTSTTSVPEIPDDKEIRKKYNNYLNVYRKEFSVDMNDANDAESLRSLVRYIIQSELTDKLIINEQLKKAPNHTILKGLGDFQRTLQQNINESSDRLGISRKQRKEKQVDDIPQYIKMLQDKAKDFWDRKTVAVKCPKCKIELARYWINFEEVTQTDLKGVTKLLPKKILFEMPCEKCKETVIHVS